MKISELCDLGNAGCPRVSLGSKRCLTRNPWGGTFLTFGGDGKMASPEE